MVDSVSGLQSLALDIFYFASDCLLALVDRSVQNWMLDGFEQAFYERVMQLNDEANYGVRAGRRRTCKNCVHYTTLYEKDE